MPAQLDSILRTIMPPLQERDPHTATKVTERIEEYRREWLRLYERKGNPRSRHVLKDGLI
jgi:hypothetical protein